MKTGMNIIVIFVFLAVAKEGASTPRRNSDIRTDKYIEMNREHYSSILKDYEAQMQKFEENLLDNVEAVNENLDIARKCINDASSQFYNLKFGAFSIKNSLYNYLLDYDKQIEDCGTNHDLFTKNYAICVVKTTFTANKFTIANRKAFKTLLENAECTMRVYYNSAWDCQFKFKTV